MVSACGAGQPKDITLNGALLEFSGESFNSGEMEGLKLNDKNQLVLEDGLITGSYTSPVINTDEFKDLVATWNADTPSGTDVELMFQVKTGEEWSMWLSYGKWSSEGYRGSVKSQRDTLATMSIDTLELLFGKQASAIKYKVNLNRIDTSFDTPILKRIYATLKLAEPVVTTSIEDKNYLIDLDVPERSQMIIPVIGSVICSPTSLSMVLEYYGLNMETEEVSKHVLDNAANIYGNWSYNVSFAGSRGFDAYVARYNSIDDIKARIAEGKPVIASVKTANENIMKEAPQSYPSGHLLVVRGFAEKDGKEYVIVNDPAAPENTPIRREYELKGFERAWMNKIVYIVTPESN